MSHQLHNSLTRILTPDGIPVGVGFLAASNLILTCAHVIEQAIGQEENAHFDFPLLAPRETLSGRVSFRDDEQDIAIIEATGLPLNVMPVLSGTSRAARGHTFLTHGVPQTEQILSGDGKIMGYATLNGIQYLQLESAQVTPGFSGAPVFDEVSKRVIGMVVAIAPPDEYQRQGTTAFAIPTETLRAACPELRLSEICPYRSLDAFTEADANIFFGRERVITKLLDSLKRNPRFLAVLGPSGSGKSSVVQAGLIPALRQGNLLGSERWGILSIRPGTQPFEQLASLGMSDPAGSLVKSAENWLETHPKKERLLILIDQFEELLVSTPAKLRAEFIKSLANLLDSSADISIVLTLRDDFFGRFAQDAELLMGWMERAQVNIPGTLEEGELREMIERPARDLGLRFASGLVDAILADARTADPSGRAIRSTILPLLEFALTQLWESREDGELTHESYRNMGGVTGGLSQWADRAYYELNEEERALAQRIFSELVTLGDETQGIADTRRVRNLDELIAIDDEIASEIIAKLVTARLLITRHDDVSGSDTVEIIHETLLREWGLLGDWLQDDRAFLLWRESLRTAQQAWKESGGDAGALLRGVPLAEADDWLEKRGDDLGVGEREFIEGGIALRKRSERNRRWVMAGLGLVALVMAGLGFWGNSQANLASKNEANALQQAATAKAASTLAVANEATAEAERDRAEEQTRIARANQLATISLSHLDKQLDFSLLLAVQGIKQNDNFLTENALLSAIQENPNLRQIIHGHITAVESIAVSPDGTRIASGSVGQIYQWDAKSGEQIGKPINAHTAFVLSVVFSPNGALIASGGWDNTIRIWDTETSQQIGEPFTGHTGVVNSVAFSPDGLYIVSGSSDKTIRLWNTETGEQIGRPFSGHTDVVNSVAFSPDGLHIVSGSGGLVVSDDNSIRIWDVATGQQVSKSLTGHTARVNSVAFNPDGSQIVSGGSDNTIRLWDVETEQQIGEPFTGHTDWVNSVAFSPDGSMVVSGSNDETIRIWDSANSKQSDTTFTGHTGWVNSVVFSPDGTSVISGSHDETIRIWDIEGREQNIKFFSEDQWHILSIALAPDGSRIVSGNNDNTIRLWDVETGQQIGKPFTGHTDWVLSIVFSPDGSRIVSGGRDNTIRLWDVETGQQIGKPFAGHTGAVWSVAFSPDGSYIVSGGGDNTIRLWDTENGEQIGYPFGRHAGHVYCVAFSPNGSRIVSGGDDDAIRLWDTESGEQIGDSFTRHIGRINSVIFSPDGSRIVSGSDDNTVRIWDAENSQQIGEPFTGHTDAVLSAMFSPDGTHIVSGSKDNSILLWDTESGEQIGKAFTGHVSWVDNVVFSPDGKRIVSGGSTIRLWDVDIESWQEKACQRAGRNLTLQEWQTYFGDEPYQITCSQWPVDEDALATMEE